MKNTILLLGLIFVASACLSSEIVLNSQTIYSKAYGSPNNEAIIYLHGGPGYNSAGFEVTTAKELAENGFYVIIYDRRGEGRSTDQNAKFTFDETFDDLNSIYDSFNLKSATLIGHSFGGVIATLYAEKFPNKIESIILIGTPISMQETLSNIVKSSKTIYESKNDDTNLNYIGMLEKMDKNSLEYSSYCFSHAMQNGFYYPKDPTQEASYIYSKFSTDNILVKYSSKMTFEAPRGFWENESYTTLDIKNNVKNVLKNNTPIFGMYGIDDGLFSTDQKSKIKNLISKNNFENLENCSHNPFIDQQVKFINLLKKWTQ
jgi:proline iminopeptidase